MAAAACARPLCSPCFFFRLSNSGFVPAAAVTASGTDGGLEGSKGKERVLGTELVSADGSGEESAALSCRTLLNLCRVASLSASKSSEETE